MKNVHRLSLMVLTVLTAAFLAVDLPLMAQMGGQQRAPQQQKGAQQGAPRGAGTAQIDKSSPKLSPQQEQRVGQLKQQAQSLFRNLQRVLGELQRPTRGLTDDDCTEWLAGKPNLQGKPQQRPGPQPGTRGLAESDDPDGAKPITDGTSNTINASNSDGAKPMLTDKERAYVDGTSNTIGASTNRQGTFNRSEGVVDGDRIAQTGRNDANSAYLELSNKCNGLVTQAQQIVNNLKGIGNEAKALGFSSLAGTQGMLGQGRQEANITAPQQGRLAQANQAPISADGMTITQLQQMGKELEKFGVIWPQY